MSSADERVEELLDRWMTSLELHAKYLALDDAAYARAEDWPKHQRPTRWVVGLARQRLLDLRAQIAQRRQAGDASFADALELMSFLSGLLGSEHIERFIPLATGKAPAPDTAASGTVQQPRLRSPRPKAGTGTSGTHRQLAQRNASSRGSAERTEPSRSTAPAAPTAVRTPTAPAPSGPANDDKASRQVISDAVRMLEWGREWPALAGLIARMADRPAEAEVWKILRAHRAEILAKARRPAD
jgi:hypothetical protein